MIQGGIGGANTQTGLRFEKKTDILLLLAQRSGYSVDGTSIHFHGKEIAKRYQKSGLYKFLKGEGVDYKNHISKKLLPDDAIFNIELNTLYIIEIKFQKTSGSVDEKLQTCDFKKKQYSKLLTPLGIKVEYIYVLNDWFNTPAYKDVLDYIQSVDCHYYFNILPLEFLGLPISQ